MKSHQNVYNVAYAKIMDLIQNNGGNLRLPSESNIADLIGVSRMTVRDVLSELETKGYISRRRRTGTIINKHIVAQKARLDIDHIYEDMIRQSGFEPAINTKKLLLVQELTPKMRESLELGEEENLYLVQKILTAGGQPVMCINDYIPERYYDKDNIDISLIEKSTFFYVQKNCDDVLETSISNIDVELAGAELALLMKVDENTPLLRLESVVYSAKQQPTIYMIEYLNTKVISFSIQKRLTWHRYIDD